MPCEVTAHFLGTNHVKAQRAHILGMNRRKEPQIPPLRVRPPQKSGGKAERTLRSG
jgi:hypothetical protein